MRNTIKAILVFIFVVAFSGCAQKDFIISKIDTPIEKKQFEFELIPTNKSYIAGYSAFILNIKNNSNKDYEIDWNKTSFIKDGRTMGTFMYEGIVYKDRNAQKANDIIFANSTFSKKIFPNNYVQFDSYGWSHIGTGSGQQGVYLYIVDGSETIKQKILLNIQEK